MKAVRELTLNPDARLLPTRRRRILAWWYDRPTLAAAAIYLALSVLMVSPALLPGRTLSSSDSLWTAAPWRQLKPAGVRTLGSNPEMNDVTVYFQPFLRADRASFPDVPLWNPYLMGGRPFLANSQSAVLSPFTLPADVLPFWRSLGVIAVLKLFIAAFGTYLLARALGIRFGGALLAGIVYAFGLFFIVWLQWPVGSVFALIPLLLLATDRVALRPDGLSVAALAAMVALQFLAGHPESSFHALFATVAFFVLRLTRVWREAPTSDQGWRILLKPTVALVAGLAIGAMLAAVVLIPFGELAGQSNELTQRSGNHTLAKYLLSLLLPDYWGRPTQTVVEPFLSNRAFYAGTLTLMLASAALLLRPTLERMALAAFGAACLAIVVGAQPLYRLVTSLPGFHTVQNGRLVILFLLCVALLAGWGLDDVATGFHCAERGRILLAGCATLLVLPLIGLAVAGRIPLDKVPRALDIAWGFARPPAAPWGFNRNAPVATIMPIAALLEWLVLAGAGVLLLALRLRRGLSAPIFVTLSVALIAADLFKIGMGFNTAIPIRNATQPATPAIRYLQSQRPARFVGLSSSSPLMPLPPDVAMDFGLYDARGYDYPIDDRYNELWTHTVAPGPVSFSVPTTEASTSPAALRAFDLLSVADLVQDPADPPLSPTPGLRLAYHGSDARIYANDQALPRAFLVTHQRVVDGDGAALDAVTAPGFNGRRTVITEQAVPGLAQGGAGAEAPAARLVSYTPEHIVAFASATGPSMLVLTDTAYPGWQATVDGKPAAIHRVDYLLRGVTIPAGTHRVEFRYVPTSWRAGWIVSAIGLIALISIACVGVRSRRRASASRVT